MNKVGIYFSYWVNNWNVELSGYIKRAAALGFDTIGVSSASIVELTAAKRRELKTLADDQNIELTFCIGFPAEYDLASDDRSVRDNGIKYALQTLKAVKEMDGKILTGINYSSWPTTLDYGITDKTKYLENSANALQDVLKAAEDDGILYCFEVVNRFEQFLLNTAEEGVAFCKRVGSPNAKLLLDTFHMNIEEDSFYDAIQTAGDYLGHFHLGEANRKPPGMGRLPWKEIVQGLKDIHYQGALEMEPFLKMGGDVGRDIKVWRDLSNGATEAEMDRLAKNSLEFMRELLEQ